MRRWINQRCMWVWAKSTVIIAPGRRQTNIKMKEKRYKFRQNKINITVELHLRGTALYINTNNQVSTRNVCVRTSRDINWLNVPLLYSTENLTKITTKLHTTKFCVSGGNNFWYVWGCVTWCWWRLQSILLFLIVHWKQQVLVIIKRCILCHDASGCVQMCQHAHASGRASLILAFYNNNVTMQVFSLTNCTHAKYYALIFSST